MEIQVIIQRVDELKAEIDALRPISSEQERRIMQKFRLDWTFHSNAIEGNSLTYGETRAFLLYGVTAQGKPFKDYLDIKGHHQALDYLVEFVRQQQPLTEAIIREIHKIVLVEPYKIKAQTADGLPTERTIQIGQYKSMPNHVITPTGEVHYYATPEETPARMGDLMAWYRREQGKLHPLILAITFHYEFVAIHPFDDGNGRMARLLMNLILMQAGYPPVVIRLDNRPEYYLALAQADAGELDTFITLVGNLLIHSLELFLRGAKGEDIYDPKDLDKKLAVLQKKLEFKEEKEGSTKSPKTLLRWIDAFFRPFFDSLFTQLQKFDRFFSKKQFEMKCAEKDQAGNYENPKGISAIRDLKNIITERDISQIIVIHKWSLFIADSNFNLSSTLEFELKRQEFRIAHLIEASADNINIENLMGRRILFKHNYDVSHPTEESNDLIEAIANDIFNVIDQNVDV